MAENSAARWVYAGIILYIVMLIGMGALVLREEDACYRDGLVYFRYLGCVKNVEVDQ